MSFFSFKNILGSSIVPWGQTHSSNKFISTLADPMDLSGNRADRARDAIANTQRDAAAASQKELQDSYDKIKELYAPLEEAGKQGLAQLNSQGFTPSDTYKNSLVTGQRDLGRKLRAMGRYNSTYGSRQLGDFYTKSAQEEADRQYAPTLSLIQTGSGAVNAITGAGTEFGAATDRTLANLGQGLFNTSQANGQQRQASANNAASTLGSMAQYFNTK